MSRSRSCTSLDDSSIRLIWQNALAQYKEETGVDLESELSARFHEFPESDSDEELAQFIDRLVSHSEVSLGWRRTRNTLNSTLKLILLFNNGISELAATVGVPGGKAIFVAVGILFEAVKHHQERLNVLLDLLFKFDQFFRRLHIRQHTEHSTKWNPLYDPEVITRICAEFLRVLGIAKRVCSARDNPMRRFRNGLFNFREALLGNEDILSAANKLDDLTRMESQMVVTQTFALVAENKAALRDVQIDIQYLRSAFQVMQARVVEVLSPNLRHISRSTGESQHSVVVEEAMHTIVFVLRRFCQSVEGGQMKAFFIVFYVWFALFSSRTDSGDMLSRIREALFVAVSFLALGQCILGQNDTILLHDLLGDRRIIHTSMWLNHSRFVKELNGFFKGNIEVLRLIEFNRYRLRDSEYSLHQPGSAIRAGTTLFMAAVRYQTNASQLYCPWCSTRVPPAVGWNLRSSFDCDDPECRRTFSASSSNLAVPNDSIGLLRSAHKSPLPIKRSWRIEMPRPVHIWDRPSSIATPVPRAQTAPLYPLARNEVTDEVESDDSYGYFKFIHVTLAKKAPHLSTDFKLQVHVPTNFPFLNSLFSRKPRSKPRFTRAPSFEEAQVALCVDQDKKTISVQSLRQPLLKVQQYAHFPLTPNPLHLHHAMDGIALFHAFLQCTNTLNPIRGISLEMHRMKGQYPTWEPEGNLIIDGSVCIASDRSTSYAFKINSPFPQDLFLSIFYFDPEAFRITIHPVCRRQQFQKAPIKSHDSSLIAPGANRCTWEFGLKPGHSSSSGFLRFFLTPHFLDLRWMSQRIEPFTSNFVSIGQWRTPAEAFQNVATWDVLTLLLTVTESENQP